MQIGSTNEITGSNNNNKNNNATWATLSWHHKEFSDSELLDKLNGLEKNVICSYFLLSNNARSKHEQGRNDVPRGVQHIPPLTGYPQFRYLSRLVMSRNEICCIDLENIPATVQLLDFDSNLIEQVPNFSHFELHTLQLACNRITHVNGDYMPPTLSTLYLDGNKITTLPVMSNLQNLKRLYLSYNQIQTLTVNNMPVKTMCHLYLNHNRLVKVNNLKALTSLEVLSLHDNEIEIIEGLPESLKEITLGGNPLRELYEDCFSTKNLYATVMKKHTVYFGQSNVLNTKQIKDLEYPPQEVFKKELYYRKHCQDSILLEQECIDTGYEAVQKFFVENKLVNFKK